MPVERTLSIIKPDAVAKNVVGQIYSRFEQAGLRIVAARMMQLSQQQAEGFYAVHRERPFFKDLVSFMVSGPVMVQVLEGDDAIAKNRLLMGATDPPILPIASTPTPSTAPMARRPPLRKFATSSVTWSCVRAPDGGQRAGAGGAGCRIEPPCSVWTGMD